MQRRCPVVRHRLACQAPNVANCQRSDARREPHLQAARLCRLAAVPAPQLLFLHSLQGTPACPAACATQYQTAGCAACTDPRALAMPTHACRTATLCPT